MGLLTEVIKEKYGKPDRYGTSAGAGRYSTTPPPQMPQRYAPAPNLSPVPARAKPDNSWQIIAQRRQEQENIQKAMNEILAVRDQTGEKFLDEATRFKILSRHVPFDVAQKFNELISKRQAATEKPEAGDLIERTLPDGTVVKQWVPRSVSQAGVVTGKAKKERPYKIGEEITRDEKRGKVTYKVTAYDENDQPIVEEVAVSPKEQKTKTVKVIKDGRIIEKSVTKEELEKGVDVGKAKVDSTALTIYEEIRSLTQDKKGEPLTPDPQGLKALQEVANNAGKQIHVLSLEGIEKSRFGFDIFAGDVAPKELYIQTDIGKEPTDKDILDSLTHLHEMSPENAKEQLNLWREGEVPKESSGEPPKRNPGETVEEYIKRISGA